MTRFSFFKLDFKLEHGLSLLEILVALAVSTVILASATRLLSQSIAANFILKEEYLQNYKKHKLLSIIESINTDIDRHPFKILPRLHQNGQITYADGSINYPSNNTNFHPSKDSTAISYFEINLRQSLSLIHI